MAENQTAPTPLSSLGDALAVATGAVPATTPVKSLFKKGTQVKQVIPSPVLGLVSGYALDQETGDVQVKVSYQDADGNAHERHFQQSELVAL